MKETMKRYNFCMPTAMKENVEALAKERGITPSALIRLILSKYITLANERRTDQPA